MSLIAGYINKECGCSIEDIRSKVDSFYCGSNENSKIYNTHILPIKYGHLILSHKTDYPIQNDPIKDSHNNVFMKLGFIRYSQSVKNYQKLFEYCIHAEPAILEKCEGEFIAIFFDGHTGKTHIVNDRFGSRPFYILKDKKGFYFSSNMAFLLYFVPGNQEADILSWLQLFCFNAPFGARTIFQNIKRLKPATHLILSHDCVKQRQYWAVRQDAFDDLCPDEHARKTFDAFKEGAEFRANLVDKGVLALSGGLDSRLVAGCLPENNGFSAWTFINSIKDESTIEVESARAVGKILGFEHCVEKMPPNSFSMVAKDLVLLTGSPNRLHQQVGTIPLIKHITSKGLNFLLGGAPGNIIAGPLIPASSVFMDPGKTEEAMQLYFKLKILWVDKHKSLLRKIIKADVFKEYYPKIKESFFESLESVEGPTAAHKIRAWTMANRWHSSGFASPVHNHPDLTEAFCHLDYEFCDLMLKIPAAWIIDRNFYKYMIFKNLESLQSVKVANTGRTLSGELKHYKTDIPARSQSGYKEFLKQLVKNNKFAMQCYTRAHKLREKMLRSPKNHNLSQPFQYTFLKQDKTLFTDLTDILYSSPSLKDILDINGCKKFIDAFDEGRLSTKTYVGDTDLMGSLATLCYSFRYFDF